MNNKFISSLVLASALVATPLVKAEVEDPFALRVRWLIVSPDVDSSPISTIGGTASVDTNITPEIDISYFFTDNIAVELISAITRHRARANGTIAGNVNLGEVSLLPPTLTLQWHFLPRCFVNPYIGAGINYTYFFGVNPGPLATHIEYENSFGGVLQAGINFNFRPQWHINLDVKKVYIDTDATVQLVAPPVLKTSIDINPLIVGVGIGYRFG
ncbi:MAG: OmpW family protein [Gammaproteobacteria bacterium]|jgi:outer membrane protein|nr:OmpW family protein [Gammaproteobacteria bacterium]